MGFRRRPVASASLLAHSHPCRTRGRLGPRGPQMEDQLARRTSSALGSTASVRFNPGAIATLAVTLRHGPSSLTKSRRNLARAAT
jgi:hypothetical protein